MSRSMRAIASAAARYILPVALIGALALVALLGAQSRAMRQRIVQLERRAFLPYAGMIVPSFAARTLDGDSITIADPSAGARQILFFFTTTCGYCRQTLPAWRKIADSVQELPNVSVVGVSLDSIPQTDSSLRRLGFTFSSVALADDRLRALYRAKSVPMTLIVADGGRLVHARLGALRTQDALDSLFQAIGMSPQPDEKPFLSTVTTTLTAGSRSDSPIPRRER